MRMPRRIPALVALCLAAAAGAQIGDKIHFEIGGDKKGKGASLF